MNLGDKAEQADSPEIRLAGQDQPGAYRLETEELEPADQVTDPGEFPEYGDFLKVSHPTGGETPWADAEEMFLEVPGSFAKELVENEIGVGDKFRVRSVEKPGNAYKYSVEPVDE